MIECLCMDINPCDCTTECVLRRIDRERERKAISAGDQRLQPSGTEAAPELQEAGRGDERATPREDHRDGEPDADEQQEEGEREAEGEMKTVELVIKMSWINLAQTHYRLNPSLDNMWVWFCLLAAAEKGEL